MRILWATRGKTWGFRFLRTEGLADPLATYEEAFAGTDGRPETFAMRSGTAAVRFSDPEGRVDRAGRIIPHEFVVFAADSAGLDDLGSARAALWDEVGDQYLAIWERPVPPPADSLS